MWSVVGCPDLQTNADVDVQYSPDRSVAAVTCRRRSVDGGETSTASWRLACSDRGWHGYIGNCTAGSALLGEFRYLGNFRTTRLYVEPVFELTGRSVPIFLVGGSVSIFGWFMKFYDVT